MTIRSGIFLSYILIAGLAFYFLTRWTLHELRPRYLESIEESLADTSTLLAYFVAQDMEQGKLDTAQLTSVFAGAASHPLQAKIYERIKTKVDLDVYITDMNGVVVFDSRTPSALGQDYSSWRDVALTLQGRYGARSTKDNPDDPGASVLYVAAPIMVNGKSAGVLTACKPTGGINEFILLASKKIIFAGSLAAVVVILVGVLVSFLLTEPIHALTHYARAVRDGKNPAFPKLGISRETKELGRAFEEMRESLEGRRYLERYIQTLTHEIKSPLSSIQGAAELMQEDMPPEQRARFLGNIRSEASRIGDIVTKLLMLVSVENRRELGKTEKVDLTTLLNEALAELRPQIEKKSLQLKTTLDRSVYVEGNSALLHQALSNILQNAVDFSPANGALRVGCVSGANGARVSVNDDGPGIPDYALDKVFDRFFSLPRPDTKRKSSGLGLSLVREVMALHRGSVTLSNHQGGGTVALLDFPAGKQNL